MIDYNIEVILHPDNTPPSYLINSFGATCTSESSYLLMNLYITVVRTLLFIYEANSSKIIFINFHDDY